MVFLQGNRVFPPIPSNLNHTDHFSQRSTLHLIWFRYGTLLFTSVFSFLLGFQPNKQTEKALLALRRLGEGVNCKHDSLEIANLLWRTNFTGCLLNVLCAPSQNAFVLPAITCVLVSTFLDSSKCLLNNIRSNILTEFLERINELQYCLYEL